MTLTPELIEEWIKTLNHICVLPVEGDEIAIDRDAFEAWIDRNDKREWGDLEGNTGKMTFHEYYESEYVAADLCEYIELQKKVEHFIEPINKICEEFKARS